MKFDYRLFHVTGDDSVYVADDGYLLYRSVVDREQINNEKLKEVFWQETIRSIEDMKRIVNGNGNQFLFMIVPQKTKCFPNG